MPSRSRSPLSLLQLLAVLTVLLGKSVGQEVLFSYTLYSDGNCASTLTAGTVATTAHSIFNDTVYVTSLFNLSAAGAGVNVGQITCYTSGNLTFAGCADAGCVNLTAAFQGPTLTCLESALPNRPLLSAIVNCNASTSRPSTGAAADGPHGATAIGTIGLLILLTALTLL